MTGVATILLFANPHCRQKAIARVVKQPHAKVRLPIKVGNRIKARIPISPRLADGAHYKGPYESIVVHKINGQMLCYCKGQLVRQYQCSTGLCAGSKTREGDNKTPEGIYHLTHRNAGSKYYKNLHISYSNASDRRQCALAQTATGGDIKVHGYANRNGSTHNMDKLFSYTWGCVALCNRDMAEVFKRLQIPSPINIVP
jgi:murein L,D-transpeptidase YafK